MAILASSETLALLLLLLPVIASYAADFDVTNHCPYTVWAAAVPGGGQQLDPGQTWSFYVQPGTADGVIWARTNCTFDATGRGQCQTGDCGGVLACQISGSPPNTIAEYSLTQFKSLDWYDVSLVQGFNVPMEFAPSNRTSCRQVSCAADLNAECPQALQAEGGCNNPCTVYRSEEYCCSIGKNVCSPTQHSMLFKNLCPDVYTYPRDDATSLFTCPQVPRYRVVFCP